MCRIKRARPPSRARVEPKIWSKSDNKLPKTGFVAADDEEPIWNPLTNSYAYRETGFEPGLSCPSDGSREHQTLGRRHSRSHSDSAGKLARLQGWLGPPNPADFVLTLAHERSFSSGNFRQSLCEPVISRPPRAQQQ